MTIRKFDLPYFWDRNPSGGTVCTTCPTADYATGLYSHRSFSFIYIFTAIEIKRMKTSSKIDWETHNILLSGHFNEEMNKTYTPLISMMTSHKFSGDELQVIQDDIDNALSYLHSRFLTSTEGFSEDRIVIKEV